ncbi:MAG: citryl-CoA lyase, partial [Methanobrevibacter sp.]|nr:citryl-CoA lyase [Methanobrevibacter sp.]
NFSKNINLLSKEELNKKIEEIAKEFADNQLDTGKKIPGFGHRYHKIDPRAQKLLEIGNKLDIVGIHTKLAIAIDKFLYGKKKLKINIDGISASLLSDLGFSPEEGLSVFIIGRVPGLISHILEEYHDNIEFRKLLHLEDIFYDGIEDRMLDK